MEKFQFHLASEKAYHYIWHELADKILEESKGTLQGEDADAKAMRQHTLYTCLTTSLKLLHPFMPFVTETIWQELPQKESDFLMVASWPKA
jgi:valyl-tRNA synthetase